MDKHMIAGAVSDIFKLMLEKQPGLFAPGGALAEPAAAKKAAEAVAAFRAELFAKLREEPDMS